MEELIPVINKLHDVFTTAGISGTSEALDLPQIVVVGSQSSGKSSVLENIVGRDFLPRGSGIVTRRPLILKLLKTPASAASEPDWAEFAHKPTRRYTDFREVRDEIVAETDRLTGKNKGVSNQPIGLTIHSTKVVDLTLIDLPGVTRIPVGDQPKQIEALVKGMIFEYIKHPNSIILAVTAANTDLSTSDALQMAREVDPAGTRTLGVLTKLDLMDRGTDYGELLSSGGLGSRGIVPLKLGYVGVVCRGQADIDSNKPIDKHLQDEQRFFEGHPAYRAFADRCGAKYLAKRLSELLLSHIREGLPALRTRVTKMLMESRTELMALGGPSLGESKSAALLTAITKFAADFTEAIDGKVELTNSPPPSSSPLQARQPGNRSQGNILYGGARLAKAFEDSFTNKIEERDAATASTLGYEELRTVIANASGTRQSLFIPEAAFDVLVRSRIEQLEDPGLQCAEQAHEELRRIVVQLAERKGELARFSKLRDSLVATTQALLEENLQPTKLMIHNLIAIELAFINTGHPDFIGGDQAIMTVTERLQKEQQQQDQAAKRLVPARSLVQQQAPPIPRSTKPNALPDKTPTVTCVVCGEVVSNEPGEYNAHLDQCLEKHGQKDTSSDPQPRSGLWGFFSGKQGPQAAAQGDHTKTPTPPLKTGSNPFDEPPRPVRPAQQQQIQQQPQQQQQPQPEVLEVPLRKSPPRPIPKERFETELIRTLMESYLQIVKKNIKDTVPKSIMHFLVRSTTEKLQPRLVQALYNEEKISSLMEEAPDVAARREHLRKSVEVLQRAMDIISQVKDGGSSFYPSSSSFSGY